MQKRINRTLIAALLLALFGGPLLWTASRDSHAQEPNRQLVQTGSAATNSKRIALVIGNGAYTSAPPLKNPPNDARDMAATLKALGFDVISGINLNQRDMKRMVREFGLKLKAGGSGLFYYAGHGVQSKGRNYLIPVDAEIASEAEVEDSGVDVSLVLNFMDEAQNGLNIVILDACRNNPFARSFRSASEGLASVDAPTGTLIAYATAPGRVASDGTGQNGLYTSELLKQMRVPGLSATDMFMHVRAEVMRQTGNKQVPWEASSLVGSFFFSAPGNGTAPPATAVAPVESRVDPAAFELSYWDTIKNSSDPEDFRSYLDKYPNGQFAAIAKRRLQPPASVVAPSTVPREADIDQALALLKNLGSNRTDLGQFGEALNTVNTVGACRIKLEERNLFNSKTSSKPAIGETIIALPDINVASISVFEKKPAEQPAFWVVNASTIQSRTFTYSVTTYENRSLEKVKAPTKTSNPSLRAVGFFMDYESANRYAKAFANAARLCGAKSETF